MIEILEEFFSRSKEREIETKSWKGIKNWCVIRVVECVCVWCSMLCVLALERGVYTLHARENCIYYGHSRDNNIEEGSIKADYL